MAYEQRFFQIRKAAENLVIASSVGMRTQIPAPGVQTDPLLKTQEEAAKQENNTPSESKGIYYTFCTQTLYIRGPRSPITSQV